MKYLFLTILLGACSIFGGGEDGDIKLPPQREAYHACPDSEACAGKYKGGGICLPSGEHHSAPDKCKKI